MTLFVVGCASLTSQSLSDSQRPTDICTAGINVFTFSEGELDVLSRFNMENATIVNCTLIDECGFIPATKQMKEVCEDFIL